MQQAAGYRIINYLNALQLQKSRPAGDEQEWVDVLKTTKTLDDQFWLSIVPDKSQPFSETLAVVLEDRAISCFVKNEDPQAVSVATLQLSLLISPTFNRTRTQPLARRAEIIEAIRLRLTEFIEKPESMSLFVDIDGSRWQLIDNTKPSISRTFGVRVTINKSSKPLTNPCLDLLHLIELLNVSAELEAVLDDFS